MIHHNNILKESISIVEDAISGKHGAEGYIIQNVFGKISVYIKCKEYSVVQRLKRDLSDTLGIWFIDCELYDINLFIKSEINLLKTKENPISDQIWVFEKYLTNVYWDGEYRNERDNSIKSKLVSFYSFKGGVGRTTTMIMEAISLARQGKKIVVIDFDLEAPGVSGLFPTEDIPMYGLLDFLIECNAYGSDSNQINIDEYIYPVGESCHVTKMSGDIYVMPACGKVSRDQTELYRKNLMRLDLDIPSYKEKWTPIDDLLLKLDNFINPDYIFIDTRSGLHQIGGITLTRYSDLAILFFYGSQQNVDGMKMTLPILRKSETPFLLINSKVPYNEELAIIEKNVFLEGAYEALRLCDDRYESGSILMDDETADHYPIDVGYNASAEVINNVDQLLKVFEEQKTEYNKISNLIEDSLLPDLEEDNANNLDIDLQNKVIEAFTNIMGGLETAAAEDEFATGMDLQENFYPLKVFTFIFEPRKFLVLGQKGVGKTALFNALKNNDYAKALAKYLNVNTEQYERTEWVVGTSNETNYSELAIRLDSQEKIRAFWYYKTLDTIIQNDRVLENLIYDDSVKELFRNPLDSKSVNLLSGNMAFLLNELLKMINLEYKKQNKVITIIYDALDKVVSTRYRSNFVSELVDIWYMNESSMQFVRSKIFLREDIFEREVKLADKVKLKNYSASITWEYDQLFAMVWKRAISKSLEVKDLYEKTVSQTLVDEKGLGYIPVAEEKFNQRMLSILIGNKMGSAKKASTYKWFKNRLADTQGVIVPRSMIDIFAKATSKEAETRSTGAAVTKSIIRPRFFEEALPKVSEKRVIDMKEEYVEYGDFFDSLKNTIQRSPVDEGDLNNTLQAAGFDNSQEEIQKLIRIGILKRYQRKLSDPVRYHFPDIYLRGLGLQRAGMR